MIWVGDVHGCTKTLRALLKKIPNKKIGYLGDLVDRGPNSIEAMKIALDTGSVIICGNHDHMAMACLIPGYKNIPEFSDFLRTWGRNGGEWGFDAKDFMTGEVLNDDAVKYLKAIYDKSEPFHINNNVIATHSFINKSIWWPGFIPRLTGGEAMAGAMSGIDTSEVKGKGKKPTKDKVILRLKDPKNKENIFSADSPYSMYIDTLWERRFEESIEAAEITGLKIICGHTITKSARVHEFKNVIFVDTGCYLGRPNGLSAYDDETGKIYFQESID